MFPEIIGSDNSVKEVPEGTCSPFGKVRVSFLSKT